MTLVDVEANFRFQIPNRIIGSSMMLEHLHPNRQGYFILSDAFADKIVAEQLIAENHQPFPKQSAWFDIPISRVTNQMGEYTVMVLMSDYPFTETKQEVDFGAMNTFEAQKAFELMNNANWLDTHFAMVDYYYERKDDAEAARVASLISDYYPKNAEIAALAGDIYMFKRDPQMANYYHKRASAVEPDNVKYLMSSVGSYLMTGDPDKSLELLDRVLVLEPDNAQAQGQRSRLVEALKQQ